MAVQAQYPSNLLFFNRNMQEEKPGIGEDYAYNQQYRAGEGFIDQSHMLFSNGAEGNPRKRTREVAANSSSQISPFSIQPQPSQFIDLRLAFAEQQQQQQQQQQNLSPQSPVLYSVLSDDLSVQIKQQKDEIEQILHAQGEHLIRTLAEKRQRDYVSLLRATEEFVSGRLREKDAEAEKAAQHNTELEAQAARLGGEARAWQARARAGEAAVAALQAQLQQAAMDNACAKKPEEMGGDVAEDAESGYVDPDRVVAVPHNNGGPKCKACRIGVASVVLFPCRHLSVCADCDRSITSRTCPVCFSFKESSVEVYFS